MSGQKEQIGIDTMAESDTYLTLSDWNHVSETVMSDVSVQTKLIPIIRQIYMPKADY